MPPDLWTTIGLALATALSLALSYRAASRFLRRLPRAGTDRWLAGLLWLGVVAVMIYRSLMHSEGYQPMHSHVDGLLLMLALLSLTVSYLMVVGRLRGIELIAGPVISLLSLWGLCASWWSFRLFDIQGIWGGLHVVSAYLAIAAGAIAGVMGAAYLLVQNLLRKPTVRAAPGSLKQLPSLESIESALIVSATIAFILTSIVMTLGAINATTRDTVLGEQWWKSPKVIIGLLAWALLAIVCHVRLAPRFRGAKAAALAITSFLVALVVLGMALSMGRGESHDPLHPSHDESVQPLDDSAPLERGR